jgi:hypothetical protein
MQSALVAFSESLPGGGKYRFESMELSKHRAGKIDLAFLVRYLPERRREMFGMPAPLKRVYTDGKPPVSKFHDKYGNLTP